MGNLVGRIGNGFARVIRAQPPFVVGRLGLVAFGAFVRGEKHGVRSVYGRVGVFPDSSTVRAAVAVESNAVEIGCNHWVPFLSFGGVFFK